MVVNAGRRGTKRKADAVQEEEKVAGVKQALLTVRPELTVVLNPEKPRRKSFEITLSILWTGIKKGPPARLKFPEPAVVVAALEELYCYSNTSMVSMIISIY
uniref:Uncharacterized protein n=1 Tax=Gadus morhua TaxID=8049 RepID=A0A8C5CS08_GADMO